jgi:hypothetical protein
MAEAWSINAEQPARRSMATNLPSTKVIAFPFGLTVSRERLVCGMATVISGLAGLLGVLIVSMTAVMLGLT